MKRSSSVHIDVLPTKSDFFYESDEFKKHSTQIKHDIYVKYLSKYSTKKTLEDKDYDIRLIDQCQIKKYSYDAQVEKGINTDVKRLYYDRLPNPTFDVYRVRGIKPKNDSNYEYTEESVKNEHEMKLPARGKYKTICIGYILEDTRRLVVVF